MHPLIPKYKALSYEFEWHKAYEMVIEFLKICDITPDFQLTFVFETGKDGQPSFTICGEWYGDWNEGVCFECTVCFFVLFFILFFCCVQRKK